MVNAESSYTCRNIQYILIYSSCYFCLGFILYFLKSGLSIYYNMRQKQLWQNKMNAYELINYLTLRIDIVAYLFNARAVKPAEEAVTE
jgi:hypothetical protein